MILSKHACKSKCLANLLPFFDTIYFIRLSPFLSSFSSSSLPLCQKEHICLVLFLEKDFYARTMSMNYAWRKYDVRLFCVHCAFNLYVDGEQKRLAVSARISKGTSEFSLCQSCKSNREVILRAPWVKHNGSEQNHSDCCACPSATVCAYRECMSFQN